MALWHKKGQSSFVRCGPGWQSLKQSPGRVHNRESEQSLGRGKTQVTRCGMGEGGGRRPDAVRQCTRAGSIFFLFYFQEGSLGIFF